MTRVVAAFAMVLGSVVALQSPAGAAPSNLKDIDVTHVSNTLYVAAGLTSGGTLQVQPMVCASQNETCSRQGWTTVGTGVASVQIATLNGETVLLVARLTNGRTWYKRGTCVGVRCSWQTWRSLGGNVKSMRAKRGNGSCATVGGLSPKGRVYRARICADQLDYGWRGIGGNLKQIEVDRTGRIFGVSPTYTLWWHSGYAGYSGNWSGGGGRLSQPVVDISGSDDYCGLSSKKQLWCFDTGSLTWVNAGGKWRKLDDGQTVGISTGGSLWARIRSDRLDGYGGNLNQVAWDYRLQVGVSGSLKPWYRFSYRDTNTWHPA